MTVFAAASWTTNAHLIQDCHRLDYITDGDHVLDMTYGKGVWWRLWRPDGLVPHDTDFLDLPYLDESFDVVTFDPPYISPGGRKTSTIPDFNDRYGLKRSATTPAGVQMVINEGMALGMSKLRPGGLMLVKCMDYVSSGKLWLGTHYTLTYALNTLSMECVDRFEHVGRSRPQPGGRRQVHARRNLSTLLVLKKPR